MCYQDIEQPHTVTCRKQHICEWCGEPILKKMQATVRKYKWEGELHNEHMHLECFDAIVATDHDYLEDGFTPRDQTRGQPMTELM